MAQGLSATEAIEWARRLNKLNLRGPEPDFVRTQNPTEMQLREQKARYEELFKDDTLDSMPTVTFSGMPPYTCMSWPTTPMLSFTPVQPPPQTMQWSVASAPIGSAVFAQVAQPGLTMAQIPVRMATHSSPGVQVAQPRGNEAPPPAATQTPYDIW